MEVFSPIDIGQVKLKNRIALAPMDTELCGMSGEVTEEMIAYYEERASGGFGLLFTEFTAVDAMQRLTSPGIYSDRLISGWERLVERVHAHRARIILQIAHHGGRALERVTGVRPVAPSAVGSPLYPQTPRELTIPEIEELITSFVQAAIRAHAAGFDGVEIHAGHGYLIGEFVSPHTNRRDDKYGGNFEKRMRFPTEILKQVKREFGKSFIVGFKFSAYERLEGGIDIDLGRQIANYIEKQGADYLHISALTFPLPEKRYLSVPPIYVVDPPLVELAAQVKEAVEIPVITVGGIGKMEQAEGAIARGDADIVALGRAAIADSELPKKWEHGGVVRPCIRCNRCHIRIMEQKTLRCAINPHVGRELEPLPPTARPKRVVVVGGGPAGTTFAETAAGQEHDVHLFEKRGSLGGKVLAGSKPTFKEPLRRYLTFLNHQLAHSDVTLHLCTEATPESVAKLSPDWVILATGGKQHTLANRIQTIDCISAFEHPEKTGASVVIVGAGMGGCELAWYLSDLGKSVVLVDVLPESDLMQDEHYFNRLILLQIVKEKTANIFLGSDFEIGPDYIVTDNSKIKVDSIVNATGFTPNTELIETYTRAFAHDKVLVIGDELQAKDIYTATQGAFTIATTL